MRFYHYTILFGILFMMTAVLLNHSVSVNSAVIREHSDMERKFTTAVDAAAAELVNGSADGSLHVDKEAALSVFFYSMYASLGILDDPQAKEIFQGYVPVFAVVQNDGYTILSYADYAGADGYTYYSRSWTEIKPYAYQDDNFVYRFQLTSTVMLYDKNRVINGEEDVFTATQEELAKGSEFTAFRALFPDSFLLKEDTFEAVKKTAIITCIENSLRYEINLHNRIAANYGIEYGFSLPVMDNAEWFNTIEDTSLLVLVQGYPLFAGNNLYFNQYSLVGASVTKASSYVIEYGCGKNGWYNLYHKYGCDEIRKQGGSIDYTTVLWSEAECAAQGAFACEFCCPCGSHVPENLSDQ